jgi:hypothetical protein
MKRPAKEGIEAVETFECPEPSVAAIFRILSDNNLVSGLYRGQGKASYSLQPSLFRVPVSGVCNSRYYDILEAKIINKFYALAVPYGTRRSPSKLDLLTLIQHYGAPTRLLDWSKDPLVALYFALENSQEDCALFCFGPRHRILLGGEDSDLDWSNVGYDSSIFHPRRIDQRIVAQKSVFSVHGYEGEGAYIPMNENQSLVRQAPAASEGIRLGGGGANFFAKILIPADFKPALYHQLVSMGISKSALYPDLAGVGAEITDDLYRNRGVIE